MKIVSRRLVENLSHLENNYYPFSSDWIMIVSEFEDKGEAFYFYIEKKNEYCFYPFVRREIQNINNTMYYDIITPFDYGGMIYSNNSILNDFFQKFDEYCKSHNIVSEFIRFLPTYNFDIDTISNYMDISKVNDLIYIDLESNFWEGYSRGRKSNINRIKKLNFEIKDINIEEFYTLYTESMDRNEANQYFYFDIVALKRIVNNAFGRVFGIFIDNILISSMIVLVDESSAYYFLGATSTSNLSIDGNAMLFHSISLLLKNENKKLFFLGGGRKGVYEFKRRFSLKTFPYYIGKKIYNQTIYDELVKLNNKKDNNFFPKYREKII